MNINIAENQNVILSYPRLGTERYSIYLYERHTILQQNYFLFYSSDPIIREAWRRWKRTKPEELKSTTLFLKCLGFRKTPLPEYTQSYWSQENDSPYQATSESLASDVDSSSTTTTMEKSTPPAIPPPPPQTTTPSSN